MGAVVHWFENLADSFANAIYVTLIQEDQYKQLLRGLGKSLELTAIAAVIGVILGLLLAIAKLQDVDNLTGNPVVIWIRKMVAGFANGYISVIRGTPAVVQLMVIYFILYLRVLNKLPLFSGVSDVVIASIAFGINSSAYVAEIIRAGILAVDKGTDRGRPLPRLVGRIDDDPHRHPQAVRTCCRPSETNSSSCSRKPRSRAISASPT